jgi:hypothetical protein
MVDRLAGLILDTWSGTRWLLPTVAGGVAAAMLWIDGHLLWRWLRKGETISVQRWVRDNFWILIGFMLAVYLACHYPRDLQ